MEDILVSTVLLSGQIGRPHRGLALCQQSMPRAQRAAETLIHFCSLGITNMTKFFRQNGINFICLFFFFFLTTVRSCQALSILRDNRSILRVTTTGATSDYHRTTGDSLLLGGNCIVLQSSRICETHISIANLASKICIETAALYSNIALAAFWGAVCFCQATIIHLIKHILMVRNVECVFNWCGNLGVRYIYTSIFISIFITSRK